MKKIITAAVLLLATALSAFSQTKNITVSGRVLEDTNEPAVQATIQLLSLPDSLIDYFQCFVRIVGLVFLKHLDKAVPVFTG